MRKQFLNALLTTGAVVGSSFCLVASATAGGVGTPNMLSDYITSSSVGFSTESTFVNYDNPSQSVPTSFQATQANSYGSSTGGVSISGGFDPTLTATAISAGGPYSDVGAQASLTYYMTVLPLVPTAPTSVSALLTANVSIYVSGTMATNEGGSGTITIEGLIPDLTYENIVYGQNISATNGQGYSGVVTLAVGTTYEIDMTGEISASSLGPDVGEAILTDDPMFTFQDPNAADFALEFSPGLTATPLPPALPLFAGGMSIVGFFAQRRKKRASIHATV
jgi:hypothetical protein